MPWIPTDAQWRAVLEVAAVESLRNRLMLALAYDAGLRRGAVPARDRRPRSGVSDDHAEAGDDKGPARAGGALFEHSPVCCSAATCAIGARSPRPGARCSCRSRRATAARGVGVDVVQGRSLDRARAGVSSIQHAHAAASVLDGPGSVRVGDPSDRSVCRTSLDKHDAALHPSVRSGLGRAP